ncbi:MAG: hypothetical protein ACFFFH_18720 [Candidatus Thorarchaeota archaeon]
MERVRVIQMNSDNLLNGQAIEEMVSPVPLQARLDEAGRQALAKPGHTRPSLS